MLQRVLREQRSVGDTELDRGPALPGGLVGSSGHVQRAGDEAGGLRGAQHVGSRGDQQDAAIRGEPRTGAHRGASALPFLRV